MDDPDLVKDLQKNNVKFAGQYENKLLKGIISWVLPFAIIIVIWNLLMRRMGGAPSSVLNFGKSRSKIFGQNEITVTFEDVADVEEAKEELKEIIEFLRTPQKFLNVGGQDPQGHSPRGGPGHRKDAPRQGGGRRSEGAFLQHERLRFCGDVRRRRGGTGERPVCAGPGEGALHHLHRRTRCPGQGPGLNPLASHDEREQTLNQLLAEMDGFDTKKGVIIMAATNGPEILDPALLEAGEVRQACSRRQARHQRAGKRSSRSIPGGKGGERSGSKVIAARTPGFVGADLANLVNEAALLAATKG